MIEKLKRFVSHSAKIIFRKDVSSSKKHGWFGNYKTWEEAAKICSGYDNPEILKKVREAVLKVKNGEAPYERDSVILAELQYSEELLSLFNTAARDSNNTLHVVDFGGSLGSTYFQYKDVLDDFIELKWNVVEQSHFVECGMREIANNSLSFHYNIDNALKHCKPDVLLLSSVLQYLPNPYEKLNELLKYGFKYIIIDRTGFIESKKDRITIQIVPENIYKASYPAWFFTVKKFLKIFTDDYELISDFDDQFTATRYLDESKVFWKGFVYKLK